jgi:glutathione S-transferase
MGLQCVKTNVELSCAVKAEATPLVSTGTQAFLALNPNGVVPVIEDGVDVLWESNTICRYLAAKAVRSDLLPDDPRNRSLVEQWIDWQATELNTSWRAAFLGLVRRDTAYTDPGVIAAGGDAWNKTMAILDQRLADNDAHILGDAFTLADIVLGLSVNRWLMAPMQRSSYPAVAAYHERLLARPGYPYTWRERGSLTHKAAISLRLRLLLSKPSTAKLIDTGRILQMPNAVAVPSANYSGCQQKLFERPNRRGHRNRRRDLQTAITVHNDIGGPVDTPGETPLVARRVQAIGSLCAQAADPLISNWKRGAFA